ncbi:MAG TPA: type B 50S ribosomal protein L31 [Myxococcota bacterium]|jgi:large subunit ribosomal protein L31
MKEGIHPDYHTVVFVDNATGREWISRSTLKPSTTREIDGVQVPVVHLEISAESHPYWTGQQRNLDTEGRVDRFNKRYAKKKG